MIIGGLQKTSLIDYPEKVSAIVFTRGCPLRCHYCHNPSLVLPERFAAPISEDYILSFLKSRVGKLDGVTVTGGEPTIQRDLPEFLAKIKGMGFLVKLDTSGVNPDMLERLIVDNLVDYIAMDVKAPSGRYKEVTGANIDVAAVKRSINIIIRSGIDHEFRTTVVKHQLSEADIASIAKDVEGCRKYVVQGFRKCDTLNPAFADSETYSEVEFRRIRDGIGKRMAVCEVR